MGVRRLKSVSGNIRDQGMCPMCNTEDDRSHVLGCEKRRCWKEELADKRFTSINSEIGIRRVAANEDDVILQKLG